MKPTIIVGGDLNNLLDDEYLNGERAVTRAMRAAGNTLKGRWRTQIRGAGLGRRLSYTIRAQTYPKGTESMNAAALVWSKAPHIISAHNEGATIQSHAGRWLSIPLEAAGRGRGGRRMTPQEWERQRGIKLRFVAVRGGRALLVADGARVDTRGRARRKGGRRRKADGILSGEQTVPVFLLVPQVRLKKRLDLMRDAETVVSALPGQIVSNWD